jgi:hypothetical protein
MSALKNTPIAPPIVDTPPSPRLHEGAALDTVFSFAFMVQSPQLFRPGVSLFLFAFRTGRFIDCGGMRVGQSFPDWQIRVVKRNSGCINGSVSHIQANDPDVLIFH